MINKQARHIADMRNSRAVKFLPLSKIAKLYNGKSAKDLPEGNIPVYGSGGIIRYVNQAAHDGPSILIPRKGSLSNIFYVNGPFWNVDTIFYAVTKDCMNPKYLYHVLLAKHLDKLNQSGGVPSLTQAVLNEINIPVPSLSEQNKIARTLDSLERLESNLTTKLRAELNARQRQYTYYRNHLITANENGKQIHLGDIAAISTGFHDTKDAITEGKYPFYARGREPLRLNTYDFDETAIITAGDGVGVGKVFHFATGRYALHQRAYRIVPDKNIDPRYVYYSLLTSFPAYLNRVSVHSSVTSLRRSMLLNFPICIPPIQVQHRISSILDDYTALQNKALSGLQVEIKARRKQYEFYREQLLTFKELHAWTVKQHSHLSQPHYPQKVRSSPTSLQTEYQSEADLECEFIKLLESQAYEYVAIHTEQDLIENLRSKLEELNNIAFTDREWDRFFSTSIASNNDGIAEKTFRIQKDHIQILRRDDGSTKNIKLIDKENIHNNALQVINQYYMPRSQVSEHTTHRFNRYDVTILVNGLPLVHVELKRRGVNLRKAFNQIDRYQQETFWASSGLFEYVQLFVISNGTFTKYYSNSTRQLHIAQIQNQREKLRRQSLHGYEFTNWWADATNKRILDLHSFTRTFFAKHTILNILTRYCVLTVDGTLMVMRPYQIVATERILQRIVVSTNAHKLGTIKAGGYIWHATGSGKTLTSFKTAQLATQIEGVEKVLFVVDRKDLDYQTMREYDSFEKGAANSNTSTKILKRQLKDPSVQIIITTIQKLSNFIENNSHQQVYQRHVVIIFDECHRSQFGYMHKRITSSFKKYNIFGFTGTPIFAANSRSGNNSQLKTTEQVFGDRLHTYTIVDAIRDKNVLPFRIDYLNSVEVGHVTDDKVSGIDTERALLDNRRIYQIVKYTLEHFAQKTRRQDSYQHTTVTNVTEVVKSPRGTDEIKRPRRVKGFNALFATASIDSSTNKLIWRLTSDSRSEWFIHIPPILLNPTGY